MFLVMILAPKEANVHGGSSWQEFFEKHSADQSLPNGKGVNQQREVLFTTLERNSRKRKLFRG